MKSIDMKATNWGIIGPGNIAQNFTKDLALLPGEHRVVAILGHSDDSIRAFSEDFQVSHTYKVLQDFVSHRGMDAVYIATPHSHHAEQALACIQHDLPVLCEKPMTINAQQCRELLEASVEHQCFLMEGMWIRFLPSIQKVLELIAENRIGNILSVKASMGYKAPEDPHSRYFDPALGGGSLLDLGIYPVFLAYLLLGKPHTIKAIGNLSEEGVDETCSVLFHYRGGQHAVLESTLITESDLPAEIAGEKGVIRILHPWFERSRGIEVQLYGEEKQIFPCDWEGHGLHFETAHVLRCIYENKRESDVLPHAFSLDLIEIIDEIREQIRVTYDLYE